MYTGSRDNTVPMTSYPTARTGKKVDQARRPISTAGRNEAGTQDGFTLLEVVCVVAILALLAAIVLPALPQGTSRARLEACALETAALLKADRNAAIRRHTEVATDVDASSRFIRSPTSGRIVRIPPDITFDTQLAARCNQRPNGPTIRFFASGGSCGGVITLARGGVGFQIRVNWLTGGVEVVPLSPA
jgi:general secretion pathway protein H